MMETKKEKIVKPKITPLQLLLFGGFVAWLIISNLDWFDGLNPVYQICIQIAFYLTIMLSGAKFGNVAGVIRSFMAILLNGGDSETKVVQLQNLLVAICQQLGLFYEKELEKVCQIKDLTLENILNKEVKPTDAKE